MFRARTGSSTAGGFVVECAGRRLLPARISHRVASGMVKSSSTLFGRLGGCPCWIDWILAPVACYVGARSPLTTGVEPFRPNPCS